MDLDGPRLIARASSGLAASDRDRLASTLSQLQAALHVLPDKPEESAERTLLALWQLAAGHRLSADAVAETTLPPLDEPGYATLSELVERRLTGIPLAHLTGRQRFMGLEMLAGPQALIPRRETELLARTAVDILRALPGTPRVIDTCTGSANVAAALAAARPDARIWASDLSADAVALAAQNLGHLGLETRITLCQGDLLGAFADPQFHGSIDLVTCNPPYISAARRSQMDTEIAAHEPSLAFDGGALGVSILQRLIREAPPLMRPGAWLVFEVGAGQGPAVSKRLQGSGHYDQVRTLANAEGEVRVLAARRGPVGTPATTAG